MCILNVLPNMCIVILIHICATVHVLLIVTVYLYIKLDGFEASG